MSDDRKNYSIIGKVEIGTDEYRDLIEEKNEALKDADRNLHRAWDAEEEVRKLEDENKALKEKVKRFDKFLSLSEERQSAYRVYIIESNEKEEEE